MNCQAYLRFSVSEDEDLETSLYSRRDVSALTPPAAIAIAIAEYVTGPPSIPTAAGAVKAESPAVVPPVTGAVATP